MLHTLSRSPYADTNLTKLLGYIGKGDVLVLLQDGVIAGLQRTETAAQLLTSGATVYALGPDLVARGLAQYLAVGITPIDYITFVAITAQQTPQLSW